MYIVYIRKELGTNVHLSAPTNMLVTASVTGTTF